MPNKKSREFNAGLLPEVTEENNRLLLDGEDKPLWCAKELPSPGWESVESLLTIRNCKRNEAFDLLMNVGIEDGKINLDFVSDFYKFFMVDSECLCKDFLESSADHIFKVGKMFGKGKAGSAYLVDSQYGDFIVKSIQIKEVKQYLSVVIFPSRWQGRLMNQGNVFNQWSTQEGESIVTVSGDNFTNQTCIHMILNKMLGNSSNYVHQYDAFYCQSNNDTYGYNIMPLANKGSLYDYLYDVEKIDDVFMIDLVTQIFTPLSKLKEPKNAFVHGDLKTKNIFVDETKEATIYKIADYDKSSINWNGIRFYNGTRDFTKWIPQDYQVVSRREDDGSITNYYDLSTKTQMISGLPLLQLYTMHYPYGFFLSYDFYTMMFSLVMHPIVWNFVRPAWLDGRKDRFYRLWESMWIPEDFEVVMTYVNQEHDKVNTLRDEGKDEDVLKQLDKMQSISAINSYFSSRSFLFLLSLRPIFNQLRIPYDSHSMDIHVDNSFVKSKDGHICTTTPVGGWCETNSYSKKSVGFKGITKTIYNWDYSDYVQK